MTIISFELTMPNKGSWNGRWGGEDKKYFVIRKYSDRFFRKELEKFFNGKLRFGCHYSWGDGWGANVDAQIIDSKEAGRRRKISKGFCGYEWMIDSMVRFGEILSPTEIKERQTANNEAPQVVPVVNCRINW